jgi:hypothetical protein
MHRSGKILSSPNKGDNTNGVCYLQTAGEHRYTQRWWPGLGWVGLGVEGELQLAALAKGRRSFKDFQPRRGIAKYPHP